MRCHVCMGRFVSSAQLAPSSVHPPALNCQVGEYISVSSQRDAEKADIEKERQEQLKGPAAQASWSAWELCKGAQSVACLQGRLQIAEAPCWAGKQRCCCCCAGCCCNVCLRSRLRRQHCSQAALCQPCILPWTAVQARELEELAKIYPILIPYQPCILPWTAVQARELEELAQIYVARGLPYDLARQVSSLAAVVFARAAAAMHALHNTCRCTLQEELLNVLSLLCCFCLQVAEVLTEKDVIRAHARDELGIGAVPPVQFEIQLPTHQLRHPPAPCTTCCPFAPTKYEG